MFILHAVCVRAQTTPFVDDVISRDDVSLYDVTVFTFKQPRRLAFFAVQLFVLFASEETALATQANSTYLISVIQVRANVEGVT